jgi:hypothetical protein
MFTSRQRDKNMVENKQAETNKKKYQNQKMHSQLLLYFLKGTLVQL